MTRLVDIMATENPLGVNLDLVRSSIVISIFVLLAAMVPSAFGQRKELKEYDPGLAKLCEEVFGDTELVCTKPATRLGGLLTGYDPSKARRFRWPARLDEAREEIMRKARSRGGRSKPIRTGGSAKTNND